MSAVPGIYYAVFETAAGWCGVAGSKAGLRLAVLPSHEKQDVELHIINRLSGASPDPGRFADFIRRFQAYFEGREADFLDEIDFAGATYFQTEVWQAARLIPRGETRSYGWLARHIGRPGAARAVGQALGRNLLPVVVPCHRVVAADGALGGFTGGQGVKRFLLGLESASKAAFPAGD